MSRGARSLGGSIAWALFNLTLASAQGTIGVEATPKTTQVLLAEPLEIGYTIRLPGNIKLDLSSWQAGKTQWGDFVLWDFQAKLKQEGGFSVTELKVTVLPFKLGDVEMPAIEIATKSENAPGTIIKTPPIPLNILDPTQKSKDPTQLQDIKTPRKPRYFWEQPWIAIPLSLGLFLALLALYAWWRARNRRLNEAAARIEETLPPEERFERELAKLQTAGLIQARRFREFHFALSEAFRRYLDGRFGLDTQSLTTGELLRLLHAERHDLDIQLPALVRLKDVLEIMDLAKFAQYAPAVKENEQVIEALAAFVGDHRRAPDPEPASGQPPRTEAQTDGGDRQ
ncbi:MAG: hypothetical protein HYT79_03595 [Elusimicrobia bacterium]|nr:hypothetical protein [Elusimicrobiota bacterium]